MRYIANSSGYLQQVSFGADISCNGKNCTKYTGAVPSGYASLEEWYRQEGEKLYRWKITSGQLTLVDSVNPPAECAHGKRVVALSTTATTTEKELETALSALLSTMSADETADIRFLCAVFGDWSIKGALFKSSANYATFAGNSSQFGHVTEVRKCYSDGAWMPFEWVNPPMLVGVEYRTTEKWDGKAVYTVNISLGKSTTTAAAIDTSYAATKITRYGGAMDRFGNPFIMHAATAYSVWAIAQISSSKIRCYLGSGASATGLDCYIQVWYTKD